jgi:hypothetical protein
MRIAGRIGAESRPGGPAPSYDMLLGRLAAVDHARKAGDRLGEMDALEALGAGAGLVLDYLQRLAAA